MGRRRRNQDTTQVGEINQTIDSQENQLQEIQTPTVVNEHSSETNKVSTQTEEIPYDDRPIPEAYFPPEDETTQEFMPEPHIQQTVPTVTYKVISKKALDALKFEIKQAETKPVETKSENKGSTVSASNVDLSALQFDIKKAEPKVSETASIDTTHTEKKVESEGNAITTKKTDVPAIKINVDQYISNSAKSSDVIFIKDTTLAYSDSLTALNDSIANDSLAKDSVAFIPVEKPQPKREIISIDGKEMPENISNTWWYAPVLVALFIAYSIIIRDRKKAIFSELQSFIKPNTDGSIFGIQWLQKSKYKFFLSTLGVITSALYLYLANDAHMSAIWIFFLAVSIFVVGKKGMLSLLEYIYFEGANVASMSSAFMVLVRQSGLFLIPAVLGLSFAPESYHSFFTYFGIIVIGIAILAFNFKIIVNFLRGITSIFYLILYLCTLEVIPVAIFFVLGLLPRL